MAGSDTSAQAAASHGASLLTLCLLSAVVIGQGIALKWGLVDDAYISCRYARNWSEGHGVVFNEGERVEGYTNFLWTALLAGAGAVGVEIPVAARWMGVGLAIVALYLAYLLSLHVARERQWPGAWALAPPVLLALYPGWSFWAFSGMETSLLACLVLAFLILSCRGAAGTGSAMALGLVGALMAMTRWEAVLLWPVGVLACLSAPGASNPQWRQRAIVTAVTMLAVFGVYYVWRYSYYGEFLPNTFTAKTGAPLVSRLRTGLVYFGEFVLGWLLLVTAPVFLLRRGRVTWIVTAPLLIYLAYVTWTGGDFFPWLRFYVPMLPPAAILGAGLIERCCREVRPGAIARFVPAGLVVGLALTLAGIAMRIDYPSARAHLRWVAGWHTAGRWANDAFPADYHLALAPIGVIGWRTQQPIIDILGLTDREVAHEGITLADEPPGHQRSHNASIIRRRPEVVLGQARVFTGHRPTEEETIEQSLRKALKQLYTDEEFQRLYRYEVAEVDGVFIPYWIRADLDASE